MASSKQKPNRKGPEKRNDQMVPLFQNPQALPSEVTNIGVLVKTFSKNALKNLTEQDLDMDARTPQNHAVETYANLNDAGDDLAALDRRIDTSAAGESGMDYERLYDPETRAKLNELISKINFITGWFNISHKTDLFLEAAAKKEPEKYRIGLTQAMYEYTGQPTADGTQQKDAYRKSVAINFIKAILNYVEAVKAVLAMQCEADDFLSCNVGCTEEAMDYSRKSSEITASICADLNIPREEEIEEEFPEHENEIVQELVDDSAEDLAAMDTAIAKLRPKIAKIPDLEKRRKTEMMYQVAINLLKNNTAILMVDKEIRDEFTREEIIEFYLALYRTVANLIIGIIDALPAGTGDSVSWAADILKAVARGLDKLRSAAKAAKKVAKIVARRAEWVQTLLDIITKLLDLSPDVSLWRAVWTEGVDIATFGFLPSHLIFEFRQQFSEFDLPRMVVFLDKLSEVRERKLGRGNLKGGQIDVVGVNIEQDKEALKKVAGLLGK